MGIGLPGLMYMSSPQISQSAEKRCHRNTLMHEEAAAISPTTASRTFSPSNSAYVHNILCGMHNVHCMHV